MGDVSAIEWTDATWNPLAGCEHAGGPGCDGCYAAKEAAGRLSHHPAYQGLAVRRPGEPPRFTGKIRLLEDRLDQPLHWRRPRRVFVNSMSDLFHPDVPTDFIDRVFDVMAQASQHTFQVLTKRPARMRAFAAGIVATRTRYAADFEKCPTDAMRNSPAARWAATWPDQPITPNVWLGTSIETDRYAWRADHLRRTPAAVRFLSLEPLLGPLPSLDLDGIDWVIVGGESGHHARPMHPDWARDIRDRCLAAGIPFFFKQWGEWAPTPADLGRERTVAFSGIDDGALDVARVGKKAAGRHLDGCVWDELPALATAAPA